MLDKEELVIRSLKNLADLIIKKIKEEAMFGISVFPGMELKIEENLDYIRRAANKGIKYLFTSLHIPEADIHIVEREFLEILEVAKNHNMKVIVDISKEYFEKYRWDDYGQVILRLDFGFSDEEIVDISKSYPVQLNASTIDEGNMLKLIELGIETKDLSVCHNYYPRKGTGISLDLLRKRNGYFKSLGIETMAFVGSQNIKRGPLYEGLPTAEGHRGLNILVGSQELLLEGTSVIIIGDSMASTRELEALSKLRNLRSTYKEVLLLPTYEYPMGLEEKKIFEILHMERMDSAHYVVRSSTSRMIKKQRNLGEIKERQTNSRKKGSITIDNKRYERYQGELQICKVDLGADERVNVVGHVEDRGRLIARIKPGTKFLFYKINN